MKRLKLWQEKLLYKIQANAENKTPGTMLISVVVSIYNEAEGLVAFWKTLEKELKRLQHIRFELIWVNDGSTDHTQQLINERIIKISRGNITHCTIEFSKNFGHEAAMIAGIDHSIGDAVICMDSDGQHPPSEIKKMIASFLSGNDCVLMERIHREDNGHVKKVLSALFYRIINKLSTVKFRHSATDFFLISRQVARNLRTSYREQNRFIRGYIQSIGFCCDVLPFKAPCRLIGQSRYSYLKLIRLSVDTVFAFSNKPLRISILFSLLFIAFTIVFGAYTLYMYMFGNTPPSGYTTIVLLITFSFSLLFLAITILSLYFEKTIEEMRQRPIYIIKDIKRYQPESDSFLISNTVTTGTIS